MNKTKRKQRKQTDEDNNKNMNDPQSKDTQNMKFVT